MIPSQVFQPPSPEAIERARRFAERKLSPEEFEAFVSAPITDAERENALALMEWFTRRYPSPTERLRYARQAYERWKRGMP